MNAPLLTTALACKVTRLDRDRFNEAVAADFLDCIPSTTAGRARRFELEELLPLWFYRELVEAGTERKRAGQIACAISHKARLHPEAKAIAWVETYVGFSFASLPEHVPAVDEWDTVLMSGSDIKRVTFYRIDKARTLIAHYAAEEARVIGPED